MLTKVSGKLSVHCPWNEPSLRVRPPTSTSASPSSPLSRLLKADNTQAKGNDYHPGAGAEINAALVLGYGFPFNVRVGYAHGYDTGGEDQYYVTLGATF